MPALRLLAAALTAALLPTVPAAAAATSATVDQVTVDGTSTSGDAAAALQALNVQRAVAGLDPVIVDDRLAAGAAAHSSWMLTNGQLRHGETPGSPGYSADGDAAGRNSNLTGITVADADAADLVDGLMAAPFHGLGFIDPGFTVSGVGVARDPQAARYRTTVTVDVLSRYTFDAPGRPVVWPGHRSTSRVATYNGHEHPDPLTACPGFTAPTGAPLLLVGDGDRTVRDVTLTRDGRPVEVCWFDQHTYTNPDQDDQRLARSVLALRDAVVALPREPLQTDAAYAAAVVFDAGQVSWQFTVGDRAAAAAGGPRQTGTRTVVRLADASDPTAGAVAVSQRRFADRTADQVVLARADVFADALAGTPLAADGPLLLTGSDRLDRAVAAEIARVLPAGGTVYLLGGQAALSDRVEAALGRYRTVRLAGADRYATAAAVAGEVVARYHPDGTARLLLVRGDGPGTAAWADSVTAGAYAAARRVPMLLTAPDRLPQATAVAVGRIDPDEVVAVGGTAAVAERTVTSTGRPSRRVSGRDRAATAVAIARELVSDPAALVAVNGYAADGWAWALPAAGWAADTGAALLVADTTTVPEATTTALGGCGDRPVAVVGPARLLGPDVPARLASAGC